MDHNSNNNTTTQMETEKPKVSISVVHLITRTTKVDVDYEFFNKKFPGLMTEKQFNKLSEDSYEEFEDFEWNVDGDAWSEDGDHHDEVALLETLNDPYTDLSRLKYHLAGQVDRILDELKPDTEEEKEEEDEEEEEED